MTKSEDLISYAERFIGRPYLWGGDDPMAGFDCSGFVVECLQSVGLIAHGLDYSADGLYRLFREFETTAREKGSLVFWPSKADSEKMIHVEILRNGYQTIGASGGGGATTTLEDAIRQNAFIKIRPLEYRGRLFRICDPFLKDE